MVSATFDEEYYFQHESDPESKFRYPLPIADKEAETSLIIAPFISCVTKRAFLIASGPANTDHPMLPLRDLNGRWAGVLQLDESLSIQEGIKGQAQSFYSRKLEFVEVIYGFSLPWKTLGTSDYIPSEVKAKIGNIYHYYYVLCIEWKDGITYRKGIAQIWKDMWEAQDREVIDLILG